VTTLNHYKEEAQQMRSVQFAQCPTARVPYTRPPNVASRYLVVGYNGVTGGDQALHHATMLAEAWLGTELLVVYVTSLVQAVWLSGGMPASIGPLLYQEIEVAGRLAKLAEFQLRDSEVEWEFLHRFGNVVGELRAIADGVNAVGIVVGQPRLLLHKIGGSVPARLGRSASQHIFLA
jgi:Universal stress protein family